MTYSFSDRPQVIFLDAVGTLFGVQGSVGEQYATVAQRFGVALSPAKINQAFFASFKAASAPAFPACPPVELPQREYDWWYAIAVQTFTQADAKHLFPDFEAFFVMLYAHFATPDAWFVYPDVIPTLERWQHQGIPLAILSNFDSRLYTVLQVLNLKSYFSSITISSEAGAAKPDRHIFEVALSKHAIDPHQALHIGDSFTEDYQAAKTAGLRARWLRRP